MGCPKAEGLSPKAAPAAPRERGFSREHALTSLLIKNGRIIDPASNLDQVSDLLIENGKVTRIEKDIRHPVDQRLDASALIVAPGFIDLHVHLREPGREDEETIESGSQAAAAGGFTTICCMPNTNPVNDNPAVTSYILKEAERRAVTRIFPIGAISLGSAGENLAEIGEMVSAGVVGISDDGKPVMNGQLMRRAMEYMSAMLASAKPRSVNTRRAASSSARCVCAVRLHCQAPPGGPSFGNLGMGLLLTLDRHASSLRG